MGRTIAVALAAIFLLAGADLYGQERPDFSGQWTLAVDPDAPPPTRAGGGRGGGGGGGGGGTGAASGGGLLAGGLGATATITQDDAKLTITLSTTGGTSQMVIGFDGEPRQNTVNIGGNPVQQTVTGRWDDNKFAIASTFVVGENTIQSNMTLSLDAAGHLLVESTRPGAGGGAGMTRTLRYQKAPGGQ